MLFVTFHRCRLSRSFLWVNCLLCRTISDQVSHSCNIGLHLAACSNSFSCSGTSALKPTSSFFSIMSSCTSFNHHMAKAQQPCFKLVVESVVPYDSSIACNNFSESWSFQKRSHFKIAVSSPIWLPHPDAPSQSQTFRPRTSSWH